MVQGNYSHIKNEAKQIVKNDLKRITNGEILKHLLFGNES